MDLLPTVTPSSDSLLSLRRPLYWGSLQLLVILIPRPNNLSHHIRTTRTREDTSITTYKTNLRVPWGALPVTPTVL